MRWGLTCRKAPGQRRLIGPWWPGPSTTLRDAAQHWATWSTQKQELAQTLRNQRKLLSQNQGKTAEDLISRFFQGEKSELDKAEKYKTKADALNSAADAIDYLRSRLTEIANEGNKEIDDVLASKKPLPEQLAEIQAIQARCNADAAKASVAASTKSWRPRRRSSTPKVSMETPELGRGSTALTPTMFPAAPDQQGRPGIAATPGSADRGVARVAVQGGGAADAASNCQVVRPAAAGGGPARGHKRAARQRRRLVSPGVARRRTCASRSNSHAYRR